MTSPNQTAPDGAFVVGGGDYNFGQDYTDNLVADLFHIPAPTLANALDLLETYLLKLPLDVLKAFKELIPGALDSDFLSIPGAVGKILSALNDSPVFAAWQDFQDLVYNLLHNPGAVLGAIAQSAVTGLTTALSTINSLIQQIIDIFNGLVVTPLTTGLQNVKDWFDQMVQGFVDAEDNVQDFVDNLFAGFKGIFAVGKSKGDVANAATDVAGIANTSLELGEWNNAILGLRNNKSLMDGIDETEEANFGVDKLWVGTGADPVTNISATSASVPIAYWRATETATKGFISWFGKGFASITAMYIDIYKANYATSEWELIHSSADVIGSVTSSWSYLIYTLPTGDRFQVNSGDVIGVGWRVTGAGTHTVAGLPLNGMPSHPSIHPAKPASTRTGSGDLAFGSTSYANNIPWFGIGIVSGDTPPPYNAPRTTQYTTAGANTYTIPSWANFVDVVAIGGGGGGGSATGVLNGQGGGGGSWNTTTLERGVDFATGATTMTATVAGNANGGVAGANGTAGASSTVAYPAHPSGTTTFTATGGAYGGRGAAPNGALPATVPGKSPGNVTFLGTDYYGGAESPGNTSANGPGGGGCGGFAYKDGRDGAKGTVILIARQS